jgi:transposase InsO family protein
MDVKYSPMPVAGQTVYVYVAIDECTRWRYARAFPELNAHWTMEFLKELKQKFPFPIHTIQTDNGHEFTYKLLGKGTNCEHPMGRWCEENHIVHRLIPPGVKELNGKVERSHRIDADYFYGVAPTKTLASFNRALERWIRQYNVDRPHKGLNYMTPSEKLVERITTLKDSRLEGKAEDIRKIFSASVRIIKDREQEIKTAA